MGLIGAGIGAALGIAGGIFGGSAASKAMKKVRASIERQHKENQAWYDRAYNEDPTQRAAAQRILTQTQDLMRERNRQAAGVAAVMGGTEASLAATKAANAQAMADATSQIAVAGDARKDRIEQQYRNTEYNLDNQLNNFEMQKAKAIGQAVGGVANAGAGLAGADFGSYTTKGGQQIAL